MTKNIDVFAPVRTKDGREAIITKVRTDPNCEWPIVAEVGGSERSFSPQGVYDVSMTPSDRDLENFEPVEPISFWLNVYRNGSIGCARKTKQHADRITSPGIFARVHITVNEGDGLDD